MRILQTPARFYPRRGGIEEVVLQSSRELVRRGHSVTVICADEPAVGNLTVDGIQVIRLPVLTKISNTPITSRLLTTILSRDWDVIHAHVPHPWAPEMSMIASLLRGKPLFVTYHNDTVGHGAYQWAAGFYNYTALPCVLSRAHRILIGNARYANFSKSLKPFQLKIRTIPFGVDIEKFRPMPKKNLRKEKSIFFVSRLDRFHEYKGLSYLLQAVERLAKEFPVVLRVAAGGELLEEYQSKVSSGALKNVVFLGPVNNDELVREYNECDVFAMPSTSLAYEGFGMVALEAMACGKPVVVTTIAAVSEAVREYDAGKVINPMDVSALMVALREILFDPESGREMGLHARQWVEENCSWPRYARLLEEIFLKAIS